ncbi:hypothetical protein Pcinc_026930 [Petrolisthes cinctipes]|uniref:Uncharacterized protein n=1 Tax=Petrolisthes cinctipes TaxID=88211 RepID=A0AAE1F631_PETCI|nr:hypothetical protein Pcinc_026930 [Petrolisthes cinctipes]
MERQDPYTTMSQPASDKSRDPYHSTYADHQDIMLSEDEEESATLAEPMTLEGAKQLAQTSVVVPASTPTPPAASLASVSPPPHPLVATPLTSPHHSSHHHPHHHHHLTSPPPPPQHHHHHHHHLTSPPPPPPTHHHHHHLTSPPPPPHHHLTSPPPHHHPHLTPPLPHHHHHIWGTTSVPHEEDEEEEEQQDLPSTVDIQAIRDSPSPDNTKGQLMTINENWASVDDQPGEDDSDAYDSDTDGSDSDSDSRVSSRSHSVSRESVKSRSMSRSPSPSNSKSDSGSQDSESDSSDWSDSSSSASDDERKKDYEDGDSSPVNKPLPRRKPQLTAPKLTLSDGFRGSGRDDLCGSRNGSGSASPKLSMPLLSVEKHKSSQAFTSTTADSIITVGFGVGKTTKPSVYEEKPKGKSSIFSDDETSDGTDSEKSKPTTKSVHSSKTDDVKHVLPVPLPDVSDNSPTRDEVEEMNSVKGSTVSETGNTSEQNTASVDRQKPEKKSPVLEEDTPQAPGVQESKPSVPLVGLKVEDARISFQPYKREVVTPPDRKCEVGAKWDEGEVEGEKGEDGKSMPLSSVELEERRREKELELSREFDRLLSSTKPTEQKAVSVVKESSSNIDKGPSDSPVKYNKVYDSPKSGKALTFANSVSHSNNVQSSKSSSCSKKDSIPVGISMEHLNQMFLPSPPVEVKDTITPEKNKTKHERLNCENKRGDFAKVDNGSAEDAKKLFKDTVGCQAFDNSGERTSSNDQVVDQKTCRESTSEKVSNRELECKRNLNKESHAERKECKEPASERNSIREPSPSTTTMRENKSLENVEELSVHKRSSKVPYDKKYKDTNCDTKSRKETNMIRNSHDNPLMDCKPSRDTGSCTKDCQQAEIMEKCRTNTCKDYQEKRSKKELESYKNAKNDVMEDQKLVKNVYGERKAHQDVAQEKKNIRETSSDRKKGKGYVIEKLQCTGTSTDAVIKNNSEDSCIQRPNTDSLEMMASQDLSQPHETLANKTKHSDKKSSRNNSPEKKMSKSINASPEKKANKEFPLERKASSGGGHDHSKEAPFEKKASKVSTSEKKTQKSGTHGKKLSKPSKERKQKTEENTEKKHRDVSTEKKSHRDTSVEKKNRDNSEKCSGKDSSAEKKSKEVNENTEMAVSQKCCREISGTKKSERDLGTEKPKEIISEKVPVYGRDSSLERKKIKKEASLDKHRKDHSSDRSHLKEMYLQGKFNAESSPEKSSASEGSPIKKVSREPGFEKRSNKEFDYMKKFSKESTLIESPFIENFFEKMAQSKLKSKRDGVKKKSKKKNKHNENYSERSCSHESSPPELSMKGESTAERLDTKDPSPKHKISNDKYFDEYRDGSKFYKVRKTLENNESYRTSKSTTGSTESPKLKSKCRLSEVSEKSKDVNKSDSLSSSASKGKLEEVDGNDKGGIQKSPSDKVPVNSVRPTIADVVKTGERRKSTDNEKYSGSEKTKKRDNYREDTSTDSESSEELNEKVDLDTEQTQTFSVSESNFNQGRLTMKIAAMKMAKFGRTGLREVTGGALPTRSDLSSAQRLESSSLSMSFSPFRRPRTTPQKSQSAASYNQEPHKVKTAAERKTYSDALPPNGSVRSVNSKHHRKKGLFVYVQSIEALVPQHCVLIIEFKLHPGKLPVE